MSTELRRAYPLFELLREILQNQVAQETRARKRDGERMTDGVRVVQVLRAARKMAPTSGRTRCSKVTRRALAIFPILILLAAPSSAQNFRRQRQLQPPPKPPQRSSQQDNVVAEMQVICQSDAIVLTVNTNNPFNGMLYARDAPSSSNCVSEFHSATNMTFRLPLKSCGTLSADVDDGIEYFNTVVVQPHMRLMTNQGKGYHIRCKYQTRERTIANTHFNVSAAFLMQNRPEALTTPLLATASMPMCTMKIYRIDQDNVAESVRVGDKLVMVIEIDRQDMYGMRISNCLVRDGLNKAEQLLINDLGCPIDENIMPKFEYENNNTRAAVAFKAHKFPHTSSVYYQCNVRLCINNGGCDQAQCQPDTLAGSESNSNLALSTGFFPTSQAANASSGSRRKRFVPGHGQAGLVELPQVFESAHRDEELPDPSELSGSRLSKENDMSFDVYSGLYVSDISNIGESNSGDPNGQQVLPASRNSDGAVSQKDEMAQLAGGAGTEPCLTMGKASLLVIAASLSSVALVLLIACQAGLIGGRDPCDRRHSSQASGSIRGSSELSFHSSPSLNHASNFNARHYSQYPNTSSYATRTKKFSPLRYGLGLIY